MDVMKEISVGIIEKWKGKYHTKSKDDQYMIKNRQNEKE